MKDFLNYLLTIPQRIGIYFAKRRALREHRAAVEHARYMERIKRVREMIEIAVPAVIAFTQALQSQIEAKRTKFPPGGIATPGATPEGGEQIVLQPYPQVTQDGYIIDYPGATPRPVFREFVEGAKAHFPANDDREWFVPKEKTWTPEDWQRAERMAALLKFEEPTPAQTEAIQKRNEEYIRKAAEQWRKFDDKPSEERLFADPEGNDP